MSEVFRNVLVGVDGSPSARRALRQAIDISCASRGRIGLVSVAPEPSCWNANAPVALPVSPTVLAAELEAEAKRHLDEAERAVPDDLPVTKLLAHGCAAEVLVTHALDGPWDLVVVGHRSSGDRWPRRRSVGARLLRSCPVPVLIVRGEPEAVAVAPEESRRRPAPLRAPAPIAPSLRVGR